MALSFNGEDIETDEVKITTLEYFSLPKKDMSVFELANSDLSSVVNVNYPNKIIKIGGTIQCTTLIDLDTQIDNFKALFNAKEANLDIDHSTTTRRYIATVNVLDIRRTIALTHAEFSLEFICSNPFGLETTLTTISNLTAYTTAGYTVTPTIGGSAPYQLPIITLELNTITGTGDYVQFTNDNNNQEILLTGLGLADGDIIVINCEERTVTLNGDPADYFGTFLELEPGSGSITYLDGFTTRNIDLNISYYKRYL